jgi:hypothetical protein
MGGSSERLSLVCIKEGILVSSFIHTIAPSLSQVRQSFSCRVIAEIPQKGFYKGLLLYRHGNMGVAIARKSSLVPHSREKTF